MLSQKISKNIFQIYTNYRKDDVIQDLIKNKNEIENIFKGLEFGSEGLSLTKVGNAKILKKLHMAKNAWMPINKVVNKIINTGNISAKDANFIARNNMIIVRLMSNTVRSFEVAAVLGGYDYKKAKKINIAGRQRMLIQKTAKEYFQSKSDQAKDVDIDRTIALFENSHNELLQLSQSNSELSGKLNNIGNLWNEYKSYLKNNNSYSADQIHDLNIPLLKAMHGYVVAYASS